MFGKKAWEWRSEHPDEAKRGENIRDYASAEELIILINLESQNAELIKDGLLQEERFTFNEIVKASTLPSYTSNLSIKREGKMSDRIILPIDEEEAHVTYYVVMLKENKKKYLEEYRVTLRIFESVFYKSLIRACSFEN